MTRTATFTTAPFALALAMALAPAPALAQFGQPFEVPTAPPVGEDYHIEFAFAGWFPTTNIVLASEALGILGDDIDIVNDLGMAKRKNFAQMRLVLRPGTKHKFKLDYNPLNYSGNTTLVRQFVFNGQQYNIGLPVDSLLDWKMLRLGYEYDFYYGPRGYAGFLLDVRTVDATFNLDSPIGAEFVRVQGPIPSIGFAGRGYVTPNVSLTAEVNFIPYSRTILERIDERYSVSSLDFDIYVTGNIVDWAGVQAGYRTFNLEYQFDSDRGDLQLGGAYLGGVVRY